MQIDEEANPTFYEVDYIILRDIQARKDLNAPQEAAPLKRTVSDNTQEIEATQAIR